MSENKPQINVTPLIDVLLVLLVIFMVVSPSKPSDFKTKIPKQPENVRPLIVNRETLVVTINNDMSLKLNQLEVLGDIYQPTALTAKLEEVFQERKANGLNEKTVFIKAPRLLAYGEVVKVIDAVKAGGAEPISLQIDNLEN